MNIEVMLNKGALCIHFEERIVGKDKGHNEGQCSIDIFVFCIWHSSFTNKQQNKTRYSQVQTE